LIHFAKTCQPLVATTAPGGGWLLHQQRQVPSGVSPLSIILKGTHAKNTFIKSYSNIYIPETVEV